MVFRKLPSGRARPSSSSSSEEGGVFRAGSRGHNARSIQITTTSCRSRKLQLRSSRPRCQRWQLGSVDSSSDRAVERSEGKYTRMSDELYEYMLDLMPMGKVRALAKE